MTKPWQERVCVRHIDGDLRNNDPDNLQLFHPDTREPLTNREWGEYLGWASWNIQQCKTGGRI